MKPLMIKILLVFTVVLGGLSQLQALECFNHDLYSESRLLCVKTKSEDALKPMAIEIVGRLSWLSRRAHYPMNNSAQVCRGIFPSFGQSHRETTRVRNALLPYSKDQEEIVLSELRRLISLTSSELISSSKKFGEYSTEKTVRISQKLVKERRDQLRALSVCKDLFDVDFYNYSLHTVKGSDFVDGEIAN